MYEQVIDNEKRQDKILLGLPGSDPKPMTD